MFVAQRDDDGAGQRRQIDHEFRLEALGRVPEHVGQHEAALGVGVDDLDGLSRHRLDDVAGALRVAVRHVLDEADDADARSPWPCARASACIRPTTQAAPAMSPFMSSMPAAGLIEMPPVSKQTPLPMKATGASPFLPPFQRITTTRLSRAEPWPTPSSAFMPSFFIAAMSSTSTVTPAFLSAAGAAGEFLRIEHIGRLVDQIARHVDAVGDRLARDKGRARRRRRRSPRR